MSTYSGKDRLFKKHTLLTTASLTVLFPNMLPSAPEPPDPVNELSEGKK